MNKAIQMSTDIEIQRALATDWVVSGRTGDVLKLNVQDVQIQRNQITVTFRKGKTVAKRGPFSVHSTIPEEWLHLFQTPRESGKLCKTTVAAVCAAIKKADKQLSNRSLRRGSLQAMAAAGTTDEILLMFSGHKSVSTLHRYLMWGSVGAHKKEVMRTAARSL